MLEVKLTGQPGCVASRSGHNALEAKKLVSSVSWQGSAVTEKPCDTLLHSERAANKSGVINSVTNLRPN